MSFSETISPFFGRCAFVWFYLSSAGDILANFHALAVELGVQRPGADLDLRLQNGVRPAPEV